MDHTWSLECGGSEPGRCRPGRVVHLAELRLRVAVRDCPRQTLATAASRVAFAHSTLPSSPMQRANHDFCGRGDSSSPALLGGDEKLVLKVRSTGFEPEVVRAQNARLARRALVPHTCTRAGALPALHLTIPCACARRAQPSGCAPPPPRPPLGRAPPLPRPPLDPRLRLGLSARPRSPPPPRPALRRAVQPAARVCSSQPQGRAHHAGGRQRARSWRPARGGCAVAACMRECTRMPSS